MRLIAHLSLLQLLKRRIEHWVASPVTVIEVPPFGVVDREALVLHRGPEQIAVPALWRGAADVIGPRTIGELIVAARHLDGLAGTTIVESQIDRAPAIVTRALCRIGHEQPILLRRGVPEDLGHIPGTVCIVN